MRYVKSENLKPGMLLATSLYDNEEHLLLKSNSLLNAFNIKRIRSMDFEGLYVLESSDEEPIELNPIIAESTRLNAIKNLKKLNIDACMYLANEIVNEIRESGFQIIQSIRNSSFDNYTYVHSVNVCIDSVLIGIGLGLSDDELRQLSQAALLHDIGKACVDASIINKPDKLTDDEYEEVKKHSLYGYNLLKGNHDVYSVVRNAIFSHHENEDGTGYPRGLKSENIHIFAKIIHVADVFDALTARRCYKDAINPADALEFLMANVGKMFDEKCVDIFRKFIALYPLGTEVLLSNGEVAVIMSNNDNLTRPIVKTNNGKVIDLMKVLNITIMQLLTQS